MVAQLFRKRAAEERAVIMKKTYNIEVDCANCAAKMEEAAQKTDGVREAVVSFMTQKMKVEFDDGADEAAVMKKSPQKLQKSRGRLRNIYLML